MPSIARTSNLQEAAQQATPMTPDRLKENKMRPMTSPGHASRNSNRNRRARFDPATNAAASPKPSSNKQRGDKTVAEIDKLARMRDERRKSADETKKRRAEEIKNNERLGRPGDVDFQRMISKFREGAMHAPRPHEHIGELQINVVVRKRPTNALEVRRKDHDSVTCSNPTVYVHDSKFKVDGITKYLDNTTFRMDHAFAEDATNDVVYANTAQPLVQFAFRGGRSTCFAYGQTGSGKTYTMAGVQALAARDVFRLLGSAEHKAKGLRVYCSFFELYGGRCIDLLNERRNCAVREDGKGRVCVDGLLEEQVTTEEQIVEVIAQGNGERTTHQTELNDESSRSHAICQIQLRKPPRRASEGNGLAYGKLSLIDLAGSERGQDTKHHDRARRVESAEINKSLLALKECVRALGRSEEAGVGPNGEKVRVRPHVPYRASKLTMVLKDSFAEDSRTVMISCVSPAASSADHTLNTLRYADRVKEKGRNGSGGGRRDTDMEYAATAEDSPPSTSNTVAPTANEGGSKKSNNGKHRGGGRDGNNNKAHKSEEEEEDDEDFEGLPGGMNESSSSTSFASPRRRANNSNRRQTMMEGGAKRTPQAPNGNTYHNNNNRRKSLGGIAGSPRRKLDSIANNNGKGKGGGRGRRHHHNDNDGNDSADNEEGGEGKKKTTNTSNGLKAPTSPMSVSASSATATAAVAAALVSTPLKNKDKVHDHMMQSQGQNQQHRDSPARDLKLLHSKNNNSNNNNYRRDSNNNPNNSNTTADDDNTPMDSKRNNRRRRDKSNSSSASSSAMDVDVVMHNRGQEEDDDQHEHHTEEDDVLKFHELVSQLVDEEEQLLNKHMECIQTNADWLTEEGELLAKVQGEDVVDYDIDEYAQRLDGILRSKMNKITDLHALLTRFREHLRQEEDVSRRMESGNAY